MGNKTKPSKNAYDVWKTIESHAFSELKPIKVKIASTSSLAAANAIAEETFSPYKDRFYYTNSWSMTCKDGRYFFEKLLAGTFLHVYVTKAGEECFEACFASDELPF